MDPEQGGYLVGPKNFALALITFELAWVDAGASTCSLAGCLALAPIHERGLPSSAHATCHSRFHPNQAKTAKPGADVYMQEIPESVRGTINAIYAELRLKPKTA
jgi:hypothetical protein